MGYLIVLLITLVLFFILGGKNPQKHFAFLFALVIYFIYIFLGPLNGIETDDYYLFGSYFGDYFNDTVLLYITAMGCFGTSYFFSYNSTVQQQFLNKKRFRLNEKYYVYLLLFFAAVAYMISRKANIAAGETFGGGFLNYLVFLADSLIIAFLILLSEKKMKAWHLILLIVTVIFYLILGFRYRIIILLVGVLYHFFIVNRIRPVAIIKWSAYLVITFFILNFISINREAFRNMEFSEVQWSSDSPYEMTPYQFVMHQTNNYKTDMMVYKYMDLNNQVNFDYGESMFMHIFIRIIPKNFFTSNIKPSIPQQEIIKYSTGTDEGLFAGSAVTNIMEYYIAGGVLGIIIFMSLLGFLMGYISKRTDLNRPRDRVIVMIMIMVLFQEITRGYLPQNITLLCFLYLTFFLFYKKIHVSRFNQHTNSL